VDKSLVVVEASSPGVETLHATSLRYRMLEPLRRYGQERLEESGEAQRVRERHAEYYLALAEGADAREAERELNAALLGLRLAVTLWWFWHTHDYLSEGRRYDKPVDGVWASDHFGVVADLA
jgi:predicted ATPase